MISSRQDLIKQSAIRYNVLKRRDPYVTISESIEAIIDDCRTCKPGTFGAAMLAYYVNASTRAIKMLDNAVIKTAGKQQE